MINAPVVIFLYNRPYQTIKTLKNLKLNNNSQNTELIVYSDGYKKNDILDKKKVEIVRNIIKKISGFKSKKIFLRNRNFGLYKNILSGLDNVFKKYDRAIILEDDILVNKFFINYMNKALEIYKNNYEVSSIHGWMCEHNQKLPNTFFLRGSDIWGWATWKRSWIDFNRKPKDLIKKFRKKPELIKKFNLSDSYDYFKILKKRSLNLNQSWGILWNASNFLKKKYYLNFSKSLCVNIGQDFSGTHSTINQGYFNQNLSDKKIILSKQDVIECFEGEKVKSKFFLENYKNNFLKKASNKLMTKLINKVTLRKKKINYLGPYNVWEDALKNSKGYEDNQILIKVKKNTIISKNNIYFFERDGSLLKKNTISNNQLYLITSLINKKKNGLNIVDFGGSLGSSYFKIKDIIDLNFKNKWNIIEQKLFVKEGNKSLKSSNLLFHNNLNDVKKRIDLIILSGSLQYMKNPQKILEQIFLKKPEVIFLDRTPVSNKKRNEIYIQKRDISSYPSWHFSRNFICKLFKENNYDLKERFSSEFDHNLSINGKEIKFEGYIFEIKK